VIWEYMVSDLSADPVTWRRRLENLGQMGWELVSTHEGFERIGTAANTQRSVTAILKRRRDGVPSTVEQLLSERA